MNEIFQTGLLLSAAGGLLYYLKAVPNLVYKKIRNQLVYTVHVYQYDELYSALEGWLFKHYNKFYREVEAGITEFPTESRDHFEPKITYRQEQSLFIIRHKGQRIVVNKDKEKVDKALSLKEMYFRKYLIYGFRAKEVINDLLEEIMNNHYSSMKSVVVRTYYNDAYGMWEPGHTLVAKSLDKTIIEKELKSKLIVDVDTFVSKKDWYHHVGVPYKRNYIFYGPLGTGKTTLAKAIALYTNRRLYSLSLNAMEDDSKLKRAFFNLPGNSVVLIEDIDRVFSGRESIDTKVSFSGLLNCLDGAASRDNVITIITTNHIDKLDPALLRPGRVDLKLEIKNPGAEEISQYLSLFYEKPLVIFGDFNMPMSEVQEICMVHLNDPNTALQVLNSHRLQEATTYKGRPEINPEAEVKKIMPYYGKSPCY